jgi:hypothetical protein
MDAAAAGRSDRVHIKPSWVTVRDSALVDPKWAPLLCPKSRMFLTNGFRNIRTRWLFMVRSLYWIWNMLDILILEETGLYQLRDGHSHAMLQLDIRYSFGLSHDSFVSSHEAWHH